MTPPAATAAPRTAPRRPATAPRRVSGPAPRLGYAGGGAVAAPPLGLRLAERVRALPDSRLLDRLLRGRLWIGLLAVALFGIVFAQIHLLKLNTGISRAVQTSQTLERQNTELKLDLSRLAGGERVEDAAAGRGFVAPATGQPRFLDARKANAEKAAAAISPPAPIQQLPLGMVSPQEGGTAGVTPDPASTAGATTGTAAAVAAEQATTVAPAPAAAATPAPTPATTTPAPATAPAPAATTAAAAAPAPTPAAAAAPATATPAATPAATGGATVPQG